MILALAAAFQIAAATPAPPPTSLVVKDASRSVSVALVTSAAGGPLIRADKLKPIVPMTVSHLTASRWMLIVNGTAIEVEEGLQFAKVGDQTYQLAAGPEVRSGTLYVPLQLVAEIIPRVATNLVWDPDRFELRVFTATQTYAIRDNPAPIAPAPRVSAPVRRSGPPPEELRIERAPVVAASAPPKGTLRSHRLVVVDAGHGGPDGGMHGPIGGGPNVLEKTVTLNVAKRVGAALGTRGVDVKYTRTTDTLIALGDRGRIANDARADLFVSIHVNAANPGWKDPGGARGFETYFLAEAKTEDARRVERMENEVVKFESASNKRGNDPLSFILNDMAQNEHLREASELAEIIQKQVRTVHPGPSRGVKQAGFVVLVTAFMPAVLVEIGFGTNPAEATYMNDPAKMDELAGAISDGIVEYLKRYERRVTAAGGASAGALSPR